MRLSTYITPLAAALAVVGTTGASRAPVAARPMPFHVHLEKSSPVSGDTIAVAPDSLRFWFSESVELTLTRVHMTAPGRGVKVGEPSRKAGTGDAPVVVPLLERLSAGTYTVVWKTAGPDGHAATGTVSFVLKPKR